MKITYFLLLWSFALIVSGPEINAQKNKQQDEAGFTLYPNPAINDLVYIKTASNSLKHITVYDVFGKVVLVDRIKSEALNIVNLSPGIYLVQVMENSKKMTRKLVVK